MKILFLGPYRQNDGWGNAARSYLEALNLTGHHIASRPVYLNNELQHSEFNQEYIINSETESVQRDSFDVVIQNGLPHLFRKYGGVKNIGLAFFESSVDHTPWPHGIGLMDQMWVSSSFEHSLVKKFNNNTKIVPLASDITIGEKDLDYKPMFSELKNDFKFYFIGENVSRKNIAALITAFHLEFKPYEQVRLVLKLNNIGKTEEETFQESVEFINSIKKDIGLYKDISSYKPEILITKFLPKNDLEGIHRDCDCFVMPSSGEGFCIPAFNAMLNGSWVIANEMTSIRDYIHHGHNGYFVKSNKVPAIAKDRPLSFLYNGRDYWYDIDILDLKSKMRQAFENKFDKKKSLDHSKEFILPYYSFQHVANSINESLKEL